VRELLAVLPRAQKVATHTAMVAVPYPLFEQARLLVAAHQGQILDETFAADVTLTARFPIAQFAAFQAALRELSGGQVEPLIIESDAETILPLPKTE
jgi:putative IMPACT (imprinted ancient) family translation regulator